MKRFILIGASNLTLALPMLTDSFRRIPNAPAEILAAHGHGRSLGTKSRVLIRSLPGIRKCDMWRTIEELAPTKYRPLALLTDIGNDLIYGSSAETVCRWAEDCLATLRSHDARIVLTLLPMSSINRLAAWEYYAARTLMFPLSRVSWPEMRRNAAELNRELVALGESFNATIVTPATEWYGVDPIHFRWSRRPQAWQEITSGWSQPSLAAPQLDSDREAPANPLGGVTIRRPSVATWMRVHTSVPAERWLMDVRQRGTQPAVRFSDGSTLYVF